MRYRAKNGFGGYAVETVEVIISNDDCSVISITKQ
jgi:hypothetical protein